VLQGPGRYYFEWTAASQQPSFGAIFLFHHLSEVAFLMKMFHHAGNKTGTHISATHQFLLTRWWQWSAVFGGLSGEFGLSL